MTRVALRWSDFDGLGHVNHAAVLTLLEEGRDAWLTGLGIARDEYVVGRCRLDFEREIGARLRSVLVRCGIVEVRRSSLTTREQVTDDDGRVLAVGEFELVLWDPAQRRSRQITHEERAALMEAAA